MGRPSAQLRLVVAAFGDPGHSFPAIALGSGLRRGRDELNQTRERLGLAPLERFHGGISELLAVVATFPQLEYPRRWPENVRVSGPLFFELEDGETAIPEGEEPLVVVAPSTSQDPECRLLRVVLEALADEPVRVLATTNRHRPEKPVDVPANAVLVPWMRYSQAFPAADAVICHGGHGTVVGSLAAGAPLLVWPAVGDQGENGVRVAWSGAGLSLARRFLSPRGVRLAVRRLLGDGRYRARAEEIAAWAAENDGASNAAELVEEAASKVKRDPAAAYTMPPTAAD